MTDAELLRAVIRERDPVEYCSEMWFRYGGSDMAKRTQRSYKVTLVWKDGKQDSGIGWGAGREAAAADYMNSAGYGGGALGALDYWNAELEEK